MNEGIINLDELLKKEYDYSSNHNILNQDFTQIELNGKREKFWFEYKDSLYLFKYQDENSYDVYSELVACQVAKILGIKCATYYPATFNNKIGIISKNFLNKDEQFILGMDIISNVLNDYFINNEELQKEYGIYGLNVKDAHNKLNNLEDIWPILDLYFSKNKNKNEIVKYIMDNLVKLVFFDMITLQGDRHIQNWGIIKNNSNNTISIAPLYDNSNICGLNRKQVVETFGNMFESLKNNKSDKEKTFEQLEKLLYHPKLAFSVSEDDIIDITRKKRKNNLEILENFIKISDSTYVDELLSYIDKLENYGLEKIIDDCSLNYKIEIPGYVKKHYVVSFFLNLLLIKEKIENYKERDDSIENKRRNP